MSGPAESVAVRLLGSTFAASTASVTTADAIRRLWSPFLVGEADGGAADGVKATVVPLDGDTDSDRLSAFAVAVNASALDRAPDFAVHAAVVARGRDAIAMPASSGVGKSTLTAACLRVGFSYLSDEALCLREPDGRVVPYPRPIALSHWSARAVKAPTPGVEAGDELLFTADELRSHLATDAEVDGLRLRHVVLLDRRAEGPPAIQESPRPNAVTRLLELSFNHYRRPADAVQLAAAVVAQAGVWTLRYSDPLDGARLLWSTFGECVSPPRR